MINLPGTIRRSTQAFDPDALSPGAEDRLATAHAFLAPLKGFVNFIVFVAMDPLLQSEWMEFFKWFGPLILMKFGLDSAHARSTITKESSEVEIPTISSKSDEEDKGEEDTNNPMWSLKSNSPPSLFSLP